MTELTGPADFDQVKRKVRIPADDTSEDDDLVLTVEAVNQFVRDLPIAKPAPDPDADPAEGWSPRIVLGATMLAQRLWRRKDTPGGVEAFGEFGVAYVQRNDPDVGLLLKLGPHAGPVIG